jgi:hypothetical protein
MSARHARLDMRDRREEHGGRGKRAAFRGWRRSRPFWGGVLLVIAGLELLAIPLSGVLIKGQVKLVIYIGIGGVFGVLIGALLIVAGIVLWVNPAHRVFYGIAGIVLGILSFPASNLGGFFLGMLLAILGGALAFAWTPAPLAPPEPPAPLPFSSDPRMNPAQRMLALAAMPAMLVAGLTGAAHQGQSGNCFLFGLICQPGSSASPSASASPSTSPSLGSGSPGLLPSLPLPSGAASPSPSASPNDPSGKNSKKATVKHTSAPSGLTASNATSVLTASSATLHKMKLVGIVTLPVGGGSGSEQALELTASSASMSGVDIDVTQGGATTSTKSPTLAFGGGLTLYTTKMCGQVEGITPTVCFTPSTASKVVLKLASLLGKAEPITMTSVTVDQMLASGASMRTGALTMGL